MLIPLFENLPVLFLIKVLLKNLDKNIMFEKINPLFNHFDISSELPTFVEKNGSPAALDSNKTRGEHSILEVNRKKSHSKKLEVTYSLFRFWIK